MKIIRRILEIMGFLFIGFILSALIFGNVTINHDNKEIFKNKPIKFKVYTNEDVADIIGKQFRTINIKPNKKPKYIASSKLDKILRDQTVSILILGRGMGSCSGTIIHEEARKHYVLTAKHCVGISEEMYVERVRVSYAVTSTTDDLAILVMSGKIPNKKVAKISEWSAYIGETVHHVSYPSGVIYKVTGKVTRYSNDWQFLDFRAKPGCSGGGIFNTDGELVSVLWGGYMNPDPKAPLKVVAEPLSDITSFLNTIGLKI